MSKNRMRLLTGVVVLLALAGCSSSQPAAPKDQPKTQPQQTQESTPLVVPKRGKQEVQTGATVEIRKSWITIRATPSPTGKAMGLAYGNDTFTVVSVEGDWVQVQLKSKQNGWIPMEATQD